MSSDTTSSRILETCRFEKLDAFGIQIWLNQLAARTIQRPWSVTASPTSVQLLALPKSRNTLARIDPGEDVTKPQPKPVERQS